MTQIENTIYQVIGKVHTQRMWFHLLCTYCVWCSSINELCFAFFKTKEKHILSYSFYVAVFQFISVESNMVLTLNIVVDFDALFVISNLTKFCRLYDSKWFDTLPIEMVVRPFFIYVT